MNCETIKNGQDEINYLLDCFLKMDTIDYYSFNIQTLYKLEEKLYKLINKVEDWRETSVL